MQKRFPAFTLIELLVAVAIIGILLAFIIPSIGASRERARRALCANNLRQIYLGLSLFAEEHGGDFPNATHVPWYNVSYPSKLQTSSTAFTMLYPKYIDDRSVFWCPSFGESQYYYVEQTTWPWSATNYSYFQDERVNSPSSQPIVLDALNPKTKKWDYLSNHKGAGGNELFCDGHIEWINGPIPIDSTGLLVEGIYRR